MTREAFLTAYPAFRGELSEADKALMEQWFSVWRAATAAAIPAGYRLVPEVPTEAMEQVMAADDWQWPELLAAAEAITEEQYNMLQAAKESKT